MGATTWRQQAACREVATDLFYNEETEVEAVEVCVACPVRRECWDEEVAEASGHHSFHGVRAGLSARARLGAYRRLPVANRRCAEPGCEWMPPMRFGAARLHQRLFHPSGAVPMAAPYRRQYRPGPRRGVGKGIPKSPEHRAKLSAAAAQQVRYRCAECPMVSTGGALARHQRARGHAGRVVA